MSASARSAVHILSRIKGLTDAIRTRLPGTVVSEIPTCREEPLKLTEDGYRQAREAEVIVVDPDLVAENNLVQDLPNLHWMMFTWAGVDRFFKTLDPYKPLPKFMLTRLGGFFGPHMAEYVVGHIIAHERQFHLQRELQNRKEWYNGSKGIKSYRLLSQLTLGILGVGDIGKEVAKAAKSFGMEVWGMVRNKRTSENKCPYIDHYRYTENLPELLSECDYVFNVLPSTSSTVGLLSKEMFSHCKKGAVFINAGRGDITDEKTLITVLNEGQLSHAILDVFKPEPLPATSRLWDHPHVTITPHVSAVTFDWMAAEQFVQNNNKYVKGEQLDYLVDWNAKY